MQPDPKDHRDFFISRNGADSIWAQWIAQELETADYATYLQDWDFLPGQSFVECMQKGAEYDCTILVMSPNYWKPDIFTHPEWQAAFAKRRFIPVRVEKCEIPALISHYVYIDFVGKTRDEAREALLKGVKGERLKRRVEFPGESGDPKISVAKLPTVNPLLVGREEELKKLDDAWIDPAIRLVSIVAFGGVGKTSLAINWWHRKQAPGAKRVLGWSFYSQGAAEDRQTSADPYLDYALREWFGVADPPQDSWARGEKLAELIRRERTLVIVDGLEPLQFPPGPQGGRLKDPGMIALLKELAAHSPGLCVCTSRMPLADLEDYGNAGVLQIDLDNLTPESGGAYLRQLGVQGSTEELQQASHDFDNHALALTLLGNFLVKRRGGDVRKRDTIPSLFEEPKKGGHARRILREYEALFKGKPELDVLRIMGLFDRPADKEALKILYKPSGDAWAAALENLKEARLIEYEDLDGPLDCHPLIRLHFAEEYRAAKPKSFRGVHSALFEHYSKQAPHRPDTVEAMAPLFHAVYHGCQACKQRETLHLFYDRIRRINDQFIVKKLGASGIDLSLLSNFFVAPWSAPAPQLTAEERLLVISGAGFALRSLGRLMEALELMTSAADAAVQREDWTNAAIGLGNLCELRVIVGSVAEGIDAARHAVEAAKRSPGGVQQFRQLAKLAGALHQSGDLIGASRLFQEAETLQAREEPGFPILYSVRGYRYCDLLHQQGHTGEVLSRAGQTLAWEDDRLLEIGLDHLSLGRAHRTASEEAAEHLEQAVGSLRRAGQLYWLPLGLLARASHFRDTGDLDKAQHDLDEVRILGNRCGMRLFLADYHLEQARLFLEKEEPAKARPHYESAKKLIEETGYHRRDPELAELTAALSPSAPGGSH